MTETRVPASEEVAEKEAADRLIATAFRDDTPIPSVGPNLPVPQPGRPPMSQKAVDVSTMALSLSAATIPPGAIAIGVLLASGYADPTVIGMICAAPAALAVPILAIAKLVRGAKNALPEEHHHHYTGTVYQDQRTVHSHTRGVWAKNTNQQ